ncbi:MAG: hypothetical protein HQ483_13595 [Rhodospirillales bacterium]|nr:hypothetical protein [Rhodospirillales bacterium]
MVENIYPPVILGKISHRMAFVSELGVAWVILFIALMCFVFITPVYLVVNNIEQLGMLSASLIILGLIVVSVLSWFIGAKFSPEDASTEGGFNMERNKALAPTYFSNHKTPIIFQLLSLYGDKTWIIDYCESDMASTVEEARAQIYDLARRCVSDSRKRRKLKISILNSALNILAWCRTNQSHQRIEGLRQKILNTDGDERSRNFAEWNGLISEEAELAHERAEEWCLQLNKIVAEEKKKR